MRGFFIKVATAAVAAVFVWAQAAYADPPPWAPAHGYRAKHHGKHGGGHGGKGHGPRGYGETAYVVPFGIDLGACNREALGAVIGGAAGAASGAALAKDADRRSDRRLATLGGAIIGAIVGGNIGRAMDQVDQHCVGQILEYGETGRPVTWRDPDHGADYRVVPERTYERGDGRYCREYRTTATVGGREAETYGTACRQPDGAWELVS